MTILVDDDLVDSWTDKAGTITVTNTGGARPTFKTNVANGHSAVRFNGGKELILTPNPLSDVVAVDGLSIFIAGTNLTQVTFGSFIATDSTSPRDMNVFMSSRTTNGVEFYSDNNNHHRQATGPIIPGPTLITCICDITGGVQNIYINGTIADTGTVTMPTSITLNGAALRLGNDGFGDFLIGDILATALYTRAVTPAERALIEGYFTTMFAIP